MEQHVLHVVDRVWPANQYSSCVRRDGRAASRGLGHVHVSIQHVRSDKEWFEQD